MSSKARQKEYRKEKRKELNLKHREWYKENKDEINRKRRLKYQNNIEKFTEYNKKYYLENKDKIVEYNKVYKKKNKEKLDKYNKEYQIVNEVKLKEKTRNYGLNNREKINTRRRKKRDEDPLVKLVDILRCRINTAFRLRDYKKTSKTCKLLGADFKTVSRHVEQQFTKGMSWELVGPEIHIDHIIPLASATNEEELIKLCHYTNLQPLWAEENLKKRDKILTF